MAAADLSQLHQKRNLTEANLNIAFVDPVFKLETDTVTLVLYGILGVVVIIMNISVTATYIGRKKIRKHRVNAYAFYLAIADLFVGIFVLFFSSLWGILAFPELPPIVCHIWSIVKQFSILYSALIIILLSYDRFQLVTSPLKYHSKQTSSRIHRLVLVTGMLCLIYCTAVYIISFCFFGPVDGNDGVLLQLCISVVITNSIYTVILHTIDFVIPFVVLVVINVAFYWKLVAKMHHMSNIQLKERRPSRRQNKSKGDEYGDSANDPTNKKQLLEVSHKTPPEVDTLHVQSKSKQTKQTATSRKAIDVTTQETEHFAGVAHFANEVVVRYEKEANLAILEPPSKDVSAGSGHVVRVEDFVYDSQNEMNTHNVKDYRQKDQNTEHIQIGVIEEARRKENMKLRRIAHKLASYVGVFLICSLPFEIASSLLVFGIEVPKAILNITSYMLLLNSVINPLLYGVFARFCDINSCFRACTH